MIRTAAALALGIVAHASACGNAAYTCEMSSQCVDGPIIGECQSNGFCSFPDDGCASGQRYAKNSGDASGQCVMPTDAGTDGSSSASGVGTTSGNGTPGSTGTGTESSTSADVGSSVGPTATDTVADDGESSTTAEPLLPDPLVWFSFDAPAELGIPNLGSLGGVADCTPETCPAVVAGVIGNAAAFDGAITCAIFPYVDALALPDGLTVAAWVRRDMITDNDFDGLFTKPVGAMPYNSWRLASYGGGGVDPVRVEFHVGVEDGSGGSFHVPLADATWTHFVGAWDGATMRLWQDGVLVDTKDNSLYEVDEQPLYLGCDEDQLPRSPTHFYTGLLDEVRLYDRALDDAEVAQLFALRD